MKFLKLAVTFIFLVFLLASLNCIHRSSTSQSFESQLSKDNDVLLQEATTRTDRIYYGEATAEVAFDIYFPLVLPASTKYLSHKITKSSFEGYTGQLVINYQRGNDSLTIYEGSDQYDDSPIALQHRIDLGQAKSNSIFQKQANGTIYVRWGGGDEGMANDSIVYLVKAKGFSKEEILGIATKMALYE